MNIQKSERGIYEPKLSEEHILRVIVEELWLRYRIAVWRINCPVGGKVRPNSRGIPDLVGWIPPLNTEVLYARPLLIEVKAKGGRRRPEQIAEISRAKKDGCVAMFADCWDDVATELNRCGVIPLAAV